MDVNVIGNLIGSLGFPIACCIALFWYITKITALHKEETSKLADAIGEMRIVLAQLLQNLNGR